VLSGRYTVCVLYEGGSADVLELRAGDEIVAVDGADVANHYLESVQSVISQAVGVGLLELRIRRLITNSQCCRRRSMVVVVNRSLQGSRGSGAVCIFVFFLLPS